MLDVVYKSIHREKIGEEFNNILENDEEQLCNGCIKFTELLALVTLYNMKEKFGLSNKNFKKVLSVVGETLPNAHRLPNSMYEVKKTLNELRMG